MTGESEYAADLRRELNELVGRTLGEKYHLDALLGFGGMGAVYAAENTWTKKRVALKVLLDRDDADEESVKRFRREAKAGSKVAHPNIAEVYDLGTEPDVGYFIVQELLEGETLRDRLERGPLSLRESLEILLPIASALAAVHDQGIVHRDLKPPNIFLARSPTDPAACEPKLIDFGISKMLARRAGSLSSSDLTRGATIGTLDYISPEQAVGDEAIGPAADVWSFGAVLFRCMAGRAPHEAKGLAVIGKLLREDPPRLDAVAPLVPRPIADVVVSLLTRDPAQRIGSMRRVMRELLASEVVLAEPWGRALARRYVAECDAPFTIPKEPRSGIPLWVPWAIAAACAAVAAWAIFS